VRIKGILKQEYLQHYKVVSLDHAKGCGNKAVKLYNQERSHLCCGMLASQTVHQTNNKPRQLWKNHWKYTIVNQQTYLKPTVNLYKDY